MCPWFNFRGRDQQQKVGTLSGGQRNRLHLAKLLQRGCNLLLLDEPTNDLDVDTLRALEEALLDFAGCAVVISPRSLVPRSHRHAHPRLRRRQPRRVVRGQLPGLRSRQEAAARRRRRPAASDQVQRSCTAVEERARLICRRSVSLAALPFARCLRVRAADQPRFLSIATGGTGGVYYPYGGALARIISENIPNMQATAEVTGASVDNLKLMQLGKVDLASRWPTR